MTQNLHGIFSVEISGVEYDLKYDFGATEMLQNNVFKRPIMAVLNKTLEDGGAVSHGDIADVIMVGFARNKDSRLTRDQVGKEIFEKGIVNFIGLYVKVLNYMVTGNSKSEPEPISEDDKKNSRRILPF